MQPQAGLDAAAGACNPGSSKVLAEAAGADWMVRAIDLHSAEPDGIPMRGHGVAIAGHGPPPCRSWLLGGISCPIGFCSSRHKRRERRLSR